MQNCLVFSVLSKINISKLTGLSRLGWKKVPAKHPGCQCTPAAQGDPAPVLIPIAGTINHLLLHILLLTGGMFSSCKEACEVSPEERQVEPLSFNFTVLLVNSQLGTPRTEISHWHLLHFLLCLKHLASWKDKCYAHVNRLKENTIVNTMLSIRNSSSVHLPKVKLPSPTQLLFLPLYLQRTEPFKGRTVSRTWAEFLREKPGSSWELTKS